MLKRNNQNSLWYLLRVTRCKSEEKSLALFGGLSDLPEKPISQIKREIQKALNHGYQKVCLPWNFIYHSEIKALIPFILEKAQCFVLSAHKKSFADLRGLFSAQPSFTSAVKKRLCLNLIFEDESLFLEEAGRQSWKFFITVSAHKAVPLEQLNRRLKKTHLSNSAMGVFMSFPCSHKKHPELYRPDEIYHFLKKDFYPPPPFDAFNLSIPKDLKLEPSVEPEFSYRLGSKRKFRFPGKAELKASVVIPAYNCSKELSLTLKHLYQQDLEKELFEVIVVDDGSSEDTSFILKELSFLKEMNFKFLFLPRSKARTGFKDHRFRAGIARNAGVRQAQGENLLFLDADILTPPDYISSVNRELKKHPVIQHPRYHLHLPAPLEYQKIIKDQHCFTGAKAYWEAFYETAQDWNQRKLPWKYISANTLCLRAEVFKQVGFFRKNYTCYGFEDTDLGWRLYQKKFLFKLHNLKTYHLFKTTEFLGRESIRRELLGLSALTFFHNTHCLSGYREFEHNIKNLNFNILEKKL